MPTLKSVPPLAAGDRLSWDEFEARWEATAEIKFAELIGGRVYMPPPLSESHGESDGDVITWTCVYASRTPGTKAVTNATCRILGDAPQPDVHLRIDDACGGQSRVRGKYLHGAPELVVEVCASSAGYDLHEKKDLYEAAGVLEYVAVLLHESEVRWHRLERRKYRLVRSASGGIFKSSVFPGLWLNTPALLNHDLRTVLATLDVGLATPDHTAFVKALEAKRRG